MSEQTVTQAAAYTATTFLSDIPYNLAKEAHYATSFVPEKRAEGERNGYAEGMAEFFNRVLRLAGEAQRDEALADLERYRAGYADRYRGYLARRSRCMSAMITGPSNFPKRQQEKRWASADNARDELIEWSSRVERKIIAKYSGREAIRTGDAGAVDALEKKIAKLEAEQEFMKAANKVVKSAKLSDEEKIEALLALDDNMLEKEAAELLKPNRWQGHLGFAGYELTNNSANIRRCKEQLEKAKKLAADETTETVIGAVRVVNNVEENRLQLFFPTRTSKDVYELLTGHGFRWSRTNGCFQAFRGGNADYWSKIAIEQYNRESGAN